MVQIVRSMEAETCLYVIHYVSTLIYKYQFPSTASSSPNSGLSETIKTNAFLFKHIDMDDCEFFACHGETSEVKVGFAQSRQTWVYFQAVDYAALSEGVHF